jgi:hypothetical protein
LLVGSCDPLTVDGSASFGFGSSTTAFRSYTWSLRQPTGTGLVLGANFGTMSGDGSRVTFAANELALNTSYVFGLEVMNAALVVSLTTTATVFKDLLPRPTLVVQPPLQALRPARNTVQTQLAVSSCEAQSAQAPTYTFAWQLVGVPVGACPDSLTIALLCIGLTSLCVCAARRVVCCDAERPRPGDP